MKSLFKIFTILTPKQLRTCVFIVAAMVVGAMLEAVGIGAILPLISIMGQPDFLSTHPMVAACAAALGVTDHTQFVMACSATLIVVYILKNAYITWETKLQIDFAIKNQIYYSGQLLANYLAKPYLYHLNHNSATLLRNVSNGGATIFTYILIPTFTLLTEAITVFVIWMMLVLVDSFTAVIVAGLMAVMLYAILRASRRAVSRQGVIQNDCMAEYYKWLNQGLGAIKETKVMKKENFFLEQFQQAYMRYGGANGKFLFLNQLPRMLIETLVVSGLLLLIVCKLMMGKPPMEIVPLLGVLALAAFRLMPSANRIVNVSNGVKFQLPLFEELYGESREIRQRRLEGTAILIEGRQTKLSFQQQIDIQELQFSYPESNNTVLTEVSFQIPKGKFVGVIGPSGAGKTTFVDILLGLLQPVKGKILVDGIDIQQDIRAWQANLAYVPQSIYLIDGTIRDNIALGTRPDEIDDAKVGRVLRMAELYDFVRTLPEDIYTPVGERGVKLSGGQRQRIGIARALYQQPEVLILDEATSALDNETEKSITDTILKLKGQMTIIAIAHRVSTLEGCDFKVRLENGRAEIIK